MHPKLLTSCGRAKSGVQNWCRRTSLKTVQFRSNPLVKEIVFNTEYRTTGNEFKDHIDIKV